MSTGEIEFDNDNNQVIYNDGPRALPGAVHPSELQGGDWAAEFASQQTTQDTIDEWGEEFAHEQWTTKGAMPGMPGAMPGQAFGQMNATPGSAFAQESVVRGGESETVPQVEEIVEEYTDGDALGLNPNPLTGEASLKHQFTLPNPFTEEEDPYSKGTQSQPNPSAHCNLHCTCTVTPPHPQGWSTTGMGTLATRFSLLRPSSSVAATIKTPSSSLPPPSSSLKSERGISEALTCKPAAIRPGQHDNGAACLITLHAQLPAAGCKR